MKKLLSACFAVFLLLSLCLTAYAAPASGLLHTYYSFDDSLLMALGAPLPEDGTLSILLAQQALASEATTAADAGLGTTFYCVVDTSSAMSKPAQERAIEILREISDLMGNNDRMVIATVGDKVRESEPLTSPSARETAISAITFDSKVTNLYQAISDGLGNMITKTGYNFNKCMLVLSDGNDEGQTSITEEAVLRKVDESSIPVFGVGLLQDYPSDFSRSLTNPLQRIAEESVGGAFYETSLKGSSPSEIAAHAWETMQNASVFLVDISGLNRSNVGDTLLLTVRCDTSDAVYEGSIQILTSDLPTGKNIKSSTPAPTAPVAVSGEEESSHIWLIVGICAAAVIAVIVIVVLKKRASKKRKQAEFVGSATIPVEQAAPIPTPSYPTAPPKPKKKANKETEPSLSLHLTVIGHKDQSFGFTLPKSQPKTIGRDDRADIALVVKGEADPKMSGVHCTMQWDGERIYICDNKSTNGTFVNGAYLLPGSLQVLENGSLLRVGSREYRVTIEN